VKEDLVTKAAIASLLDEFYLRIESDDLLRPYFKSIDWPAHKSRMVSFWSFILLNEPGYMQNVFDVHRDMAIGEEHFLRWLFHFEETIRDKFNGSNCDIAITRARLMAISFSSKMVSKE
jgi:hemoglobin